MALIRIVLFLFALSASLAGCTPQAGLLMSAIPDGTASALLSHLQGVEDTNRRRIVELEQQKDWNGLAAFAEDNYKRDPFTPDWLVVAGYAYTRLGQHGEASRCYLELVRRAPDNAFGWALLGDAYRGAGQPARAVATLEQGLLAHPDDPQLSYLLGESYTDMRRWPDAARAYRQSLRAEPQNAPAWYGLGVASVYSQRVDDARDALRALEKLDQALAAKLKALLQSAR